MAKQTKKRQVVASPDRSRGVSVAPVQPISRLRQRFLKFDWFRGDYVEIPTPKPAAREPEIPQSWQDGDVHPLSFAAFRNRDELGSPAAYTDYDF